MVGIAQLVEHLVVVQGAAGSSPVTHPAARSCLRKAQRWPGSYFVRRFAPRAGGFAHPHPPCGGWGGL
jgi:hypothetical protein